MRAKVEKNRPPCFAIYLLNARSRAAALVERPIVVVASSRHAHRATPRRGLSSSAFLVVVVQHMRSRP